MPNCQKCYRPFPNRILVDGEEKNLSSRIRCLKCSPFGEHNTSPITPRKGVRIGQNTRCSCCNRKYIYDKGKGHKALVCNSCVGNAKRKNLKERAVALKGGKCQKCGYDKCLAALEFHHRIKRHKKFGIAQATSLKWSKVQRELKKCDLLCANCHKETEYGDIQNGQD